MPTIKYVVFLFALAACAGFQFAQGADATATARTRDVLIMLEKSGYQAWQSKDAMFWDSFLSDKFVGYGSTGKLNKAAAAQEFQGIGCEIKSFALSDEQMRMLGPETALLTYQTTIDGMCEGQKIPAHSWAASVYVRDGDRWKGAFHSESAVVDPAALATKPAGNNQAPSPEKLASATADATTDALLAMEKRVWEDWRQHDSKKLGKLMTKEISFINIFGIYLGTRAAALKDWSGTGCEIKRIDFTDAQATMFSPTVGILTFKATADGTCYGRVPPRIWGSSIYRKQGDTWKWTFGINKPAVR